MRSVMTESLAIFLLLSACRTTSPQSDALESAPVTPPSSMPSQEYALIAPSSVSLAANGDLAVVFKAPCTELDFETYAGLTDDSGDLAVAVAVVYPSAYCRPGPLKEFHRTLAADDPRYGNVIVADAKIYKPILLNAYKAVGASVVPDGDAFQLAFPSNCQAVDFESVVVGSNDSGDQTLYVGVIYPLRGCAPGTARITRAIRSSDALFTHLMAGAVDVTYGKMNFAANAAPYALIGPTSVALVDSRTLKVEFDAPCADLDFESYVAHMDDSGDMAVKIGVVYATSSCEGGAMTRYERMLRSSDPEYAELFVADAADYVPIIRTRYQVAPASVSRTGQNLRISFKAPCSTIDFEKLLTSSDDSGDRQLAVGVLYATRDCVPANATSHVRTFEPRNREFDALAGSEAGISYVPMVAD